VPEAPVSVTVALADKFDTLTGLFAIGELPTGSKDPFALRRAALGIIRIILQNKLRMPLHVALGKVTSQYNKKFYATSPKETSEALLQFFMDRLKVMLKEDGVRHDVIQAVFADGKEDDLLLIVRKAKALQAFLSGEAGDALMTAYRRASNILQAEEKKDNNRYDGRPDEGLMELEEEKLLLKELKSREDMVSAALKEEDYTKAMEALAALRAPLDAYFEKVMVNAEDASVRTNRLRTLNYIRTYVNQIADFDAIEG
jgi:glycyl-tRNA synthetase beta chain